MVRRDEIPCTSCKSYNCKEREERRFACKPHNCPLLNAWLLEKAPQLTNENAEEHVQFPEAAVQYIV